MVIDCFRSGCILLCHCLDMVTMCLSLWMMSVLYQIHYSYCESSHCDQVQTDGKIISVNMKCSWNTAFSLLQYAEAGSQFCHLLFFCPLLFPCTDDDTGLQSLPGELPVVAASRTSAPSLSHLTSSLWVICTLQCMLLFQRGTWSASHAIDPLKVYLSGFLDISAMLGSLLSWSFDRTESKISSIPSMLCHYQWFLNMKYSNLFKFLAVFWRMSVYLVHCLEIFLGFMTQSGSTLGSSVCRHGANKSWDCCQKLPQGDSHLSSSYCSERFYGFSSADSFLLPWKMGTRKWPFLQRSWPWI